MIVSSNLMEKRLCVTSTYSLQKDRISGLPDEILVTILSCLAMKEAARTKENKRSQGNKRSLGPEAHTKSNQELSCQKQYKANCRKSKIIRLLQHRSKAQHKARITPILAEITLCHHKA